MSKTLETDSHRRSQAPEEQRWILLELWTLEHHNHRRWHHRGFCTLCRRMTHQPHQKTVNDTECAYCIHVGQSRWFQGIVGCRGTEQTCCFCHWKILKVQIGLWFFLNIHPFRLVTQISRKNYVKVLLASQPGRQWILSGALDVASAQLCHVHELLPRLHRNPSALKLALSWRWCQLEKEGCSPVNSVTLDRELIQRVTFHRSWRCFYELQTERDQEGNVRIPASQQTIYENMIEYVYRDCCYAVFVWLQLSSSSHLRIYIFGCIINWLWLWSNRIQPQAPRLLAALNQTCQEGLSLAYCGKL